MATKPKSKKKPQTNSKPPLTESGELKKSRRQEVPKQYFLFDSGEIALSFTPQVLVDFREMWKAGISAENMAKKLKVKPIEIVLMVIDQSYKQHITERETGLDGL